MLLGLHLKIAVRVIDNNECIPINNGNYHTFQSPTSPTAFSRLCCFLTCGSRKKQDIFCASKSLLIRTNPPERIPPPWYVNYIQWLSNYPKTPWYTVKNIKKCNRIIPCYPMILYGYVYIAIPPKKSGADGFFCWRVFGSMGCFRWIGSMGMVYLPTFVVGFIVGINYRVGTYIYILVP